MRNEDKDKNGERNTDRMTENRGKEMVKRRLDEEEYLPLHLGWIG